MNSHRLHSTGNLKFNLKGFAVGNGCTDPLECEFQNDYGVYQMELFRDFGFISQEQYDLVDSKCKNQGSKLPDDCIKIMDEVTLLPLRLMTLLMDSTSMTPSSHAMRTIMPMEKEWA